MVTVSSFGTRPRIEYLESGALVARAGTQMNCGGVAELVLSFEETEGTAVDVVVSPSLEMKPAEETFEPLLWLPSIQRGIEAGRTNHNRAGGLRATLHRFWLHVADTNHLRVAEAAERAADAWLSHRPELHLDQTADDDES